jgi:hypothetical protein
VVPEANPQPVIPSSNDGLEKGLGVEVAHVTISDTSVETAYTARIKERGSKRIETRDCNRGMVGNERLVNLARQAKVANDNKSREKEGMSDHQFRKLCACGEKAS